MLKILHEDDQLLVINKPAGLVCHPTKTDEYSSLISRVRLYLGAESRPHLINRLDRETSGVTVVAKRDDAALGLRRAWENRQVQKEYLAIVHGRPADHGTIDVPLGKDIASRVAIKDCVRPDGAPARTEYRLLSAWTCSANSINSSTPACHSQTLKPFNSLTSFSLLLVLPQTGRKHQIRIHLAHIGHPIVGDKLYGGDEDLYLALVENRLTSEQRTRLILPYHALHASRLSFDWHGEPLTFTAEPEPWFTGFLGDHLPTPTNGF